MRIEKVEPSGRPVIWTSLKLGPDLTGHPSGSTFPILTMTQWKILFVFPQLGRYVWTRRIQFLLQNVHVVSFSDNDDVICCFVSRSKDYLLCNISIFLFNACTERLGGWLYKCGCEVNFSILMSTMRKNSFFRSLRACTPTPFFLHNHLQYARSAFLTI